MSLGGKMARPTKDSGKVLKAYIKLAKKLGKLPSFRDAKRNGISERQINNHFQSIYDLRVVALKVDPKLKNLKLTKPTSDYEKTLVYKILGVHSEK